MTRTIVAWLQETGADAAATEASGPLPALLQWDYLEFTITLIGTIVVLWITHVLLERRRFFRLPAVGIQLILLSLTFAGLIAVVTALPGTNKELLNILGIVLGAAVAFASTTFIGNGLAGLMLRSVRPFEIGDWLELEGHFGAILERGIFHTLIQTEHLDLTTLPNLYLTSHPFTIIPARDRVDLAGKVRKPGTRVSADVSLGYEADHYHVEELLKAAVERIGLDEPRIHIVDLRDFSVTYRVQGVTNEIDRLLAVRSRLRTAVLDTLHAADIEIASPTLMNTRAYEIDYRFAARPSKKSGAEGDTPLEQEAVDLPEVVEAKTLDTQRVALEQKLAELPKLAKEAEGAEKQQIEAEIERTRQALDSLKQAEDRKQGDGA